MLHSPIIQSRFITKVVPVVVCNIANLHLLKLHIGFCLISLFVSPSGPGPGEQLAPSKEDKNVIKVKIFNAKNLHGLDGIYRDCINPSVSVEWNGLIRETTVCSSWA